MHKFGLWIAFASLFISTPTLAQATPDSLANSAFNALKNNGSTEFLDDMVSNAPLLETKMVEKTTIINAMDQLLSYYGKVESWEMIHEKNVSSRFIERAYLIFLEKYAIQVTMQFYRTGDGWTTTKFYFDDQIQKFLPE